MYNYKTEQKVALERKTFIRKKWMTCAVFSWLVTSCDLAKKPQKNCCPLSLAKAESSLTLLFRCRTTQMKSGWKCGWLWHQRLQFAVSHSALVSFQPFLFETWPWSFLELYWSFYHCELIILNILLHMVLFNIIHLTFNPFKDKIKRFVWINPVIFNEMVQQ